jgi:hypothetical protein
MASEQEDDRAQQLEALRRYMVRLDREWQPPAQVGIPPERAGEEVAGAGGPGRPSAAWLVVAGLLVVLALTGGVVIGAVVWGGDRPAGEANGASVATASRSPNAASGAPVATPACKTAVDRANAMLASAVKLRGALATQDRFLDDPANQGLEVGEALRRLAASREAGGAEGERFDLALDAYRQVVDQCDLRAP